MNTLTSLRLDQWMREPTQIHTIELKNTVGLVVTRAGDIGLIKYLTVSTALPLFPPPLTIYDLSDHVLIIGTIDTERQNRLIAKGTRSDNIDI